MREHFRCTTSRDDKEEIEELPNDERYLSMLARRFGIELDSAYENLVHCLNNGFAFPDFV